VECGAGRLMVRKEEMVNVFVLEEDLTKAFDLEGVIG
jgi:hypothetical protein